MTVIDFSFLIFIYFYLKNLKPFFSFDLFQIEGFDDGGGRVIVKLAIGGLKVTMNECMVQPIAKQEFAKYGKILSEYENRRSSRSKFL